MADRYGALREILRQAEEYRGKDVNMYELADLTLSMCKLLRHATWKDPGDEYELGVISGRLERLIEDMLMGDMGNDVKECD